jgi:radical SAM superfamily enzyme YgiQ (UPF0313 family)
VIFVAFEEFDNLGTGYLCSILSKNGFKTRVIDFRHNNYEILELVNRLDPLVIGFSVIFESYIKKFQKLVSLLREGGIRCHFTAGGHYASLRHEELFTLIPSLDSIVRFDGEYTMLELTKRIYAGKEWIKTDGIVYKKKGKIINNPLRPLEKDLDKYPFPMRFPLKEYAFGKKYAAILAGRGCAYNCSYCCLREYYKKAPGPSRRIRSPENVVREMELLHLDKECSVYLFQDDDFPLNTGHRSEWIKRFCKELNRKRLNDKIMWKINCRPDEIYEKNIDMMKSCGLFLIFIGIEDGTDTGLARLNKHMTAAKCLEGINILRKLEIDFDYGFMLFQPSSTFVSINENLNFLKLITSGGITPVIFNKLLPYFGTEIEKELRKDGRLKGSPDFPDYIFFEESLNRYHDFIKDCFADWLTNAGGIVNILRLARNYYSVYSRYYGTSPESRSLNHKVRRVTEKSNNFILDTMKELAWLFESERNNSLLNTILKDYRTKIRSHHRYYVKKINSTVSCMMQLATDN